MNYSSILFGFLFSIAFGQASAQGGSLLALKDKGVVVKSYTEGSYILVQLSTQQWITGHVDWIRNDSIQIKQFTLQTVTTAFGTLSQDTLKLGRLAFHKSDIKALPKPNGGFNSVFTNGALFKAGGVLYVGLNVANSLYRKDPVFESKNIPHLIGGGISWIVGKILQRSNPNFCPIGKRFSIEIL